MTNQLTIIGIILCSLGSIILARDVFKNQPPKIQLYIYTDEENRQKQNLSDKKYKYTKRINIIGVSLNLLGVICQILALFL